LIIFCSGFMFRAISKCFCYDIKSDIKCWVVNENISNGKETLNLHKKYSSRVYNEFIV
jgi:hypothetical protein